MYQYVSQWIKNCHTCRRITPSYKAWQGILRPLPVPEHAWQDISMDFITYLPTSQGFDSILVIVDCLTKIRHLIACQATINAEGVAYLYTQHVWRLHGLPWTITSDRGPQFVAEFWRYLNKRLSIKSLLLTAFYPETNSQTEQINAILEQYLQAYITYLQDNWYTWLLLAEFALNTTYSEAIKTSLFFANYGFHPCIGFEPVPVPDCPASQDAKEFARKMQAISDYVRSQMTSAQARYEEQSNKTRQPARQYKAGQYIWLDTHNICILRPSKKLDWKFLGPFTIKRMINVHAYELDLPASIQIYLVFNVTLLCPAADNPVPCQRADPLLPIKVKGLEEYKVESILDSRWERRGRGAPCLKYTVK